MKYYDDKYKKILSEESTIPEAVSSRTKMVFSRIRSEEKNNIEEREYMIMRKSSKKRFVLLVAIIAMIFSTTVYAAVRTWGLSDFFARSGDELPKEAKELVQTDIEQDAHGMAGVDFKVREAVSDKQKIYVVLEVKPADAKKYLLLTMDSTSNESISNLGITTDKDETIAEYAAENKKDMLYVNASFQNQGTYIPCSADYVTEEDGTLVLMYKMDNTFPDANLKLTCKTSVIPVDPAGEFGEEVKDSFDFQLSDKSTESSVSYSQKGTLAVEGTGVVVDKIELSKTELGIYTELTFHISKSATPEQISLAKDGLWFEYLDSDGNGWESGLNGTDSIEMVSEGVYVQKNNFKMTDIPDKITVRGFDCWEKTKFGVITLEKN